eukprot:TRINITY_DN5026_c0_g1_i10.p1 TRINITY_DN5026_c0_g1~~TRINITY_DN5026_c0_g1_i10.p1  ORF type:complete len:113 (-),score=15.37 TRINITY_DN5026_c0_g1_i10:533-871(-)
MNHNVKDGTDLIAKIKEHLANLNKMKLTSKKLDVTPFRLHLLSQLLLFRNDVGSCSASKVMSTISNAKPSPNLFESSNQNRKESSKSHGVPSCDRAAFGMGNHIIHPHFDTL